MTRNGMPKVTRWFIAVLAAVALVGACGGQAAQSPPQPTTTAALPSPTTGQASFGPTPDATVNPTSAVTTAEPVESSPPESPPATMDVGASCTVIATSLLNPRGIAVSTDGTVYIAEAGDGGDVPDFREAGAGASPEASPGSSPTPITSHGDTGRVSTVSPDGTQAVLVDGLTSYNFLAEVVGPADVAVADDGTLYVSVGGPGPVLAQIVPAGHAGRVISIDSSGTVTTVADIGAYERAENPDPNAVDSNLGGIAIGSDGLLYVADSGGNTVYTVDPASGEVSVLAVFAGLPSPDGAPNQSRGGAAEVDPVPTDVSADPDGGAFVGFLTGAALWGIPGSAKVAHVDPAGAITDAATGLNMVVGIALDNGTLYASELSLNMLAARPAPGEVVIAGESGPQVAVPDLSLPYGIAFGPDGSLYVSINASAPSGRPANGQVLRCDLSGG